jgi:hypothetical protein
MEVVFWQLTIIASIAFVWFAFPSTIGKRLTLALAATWTAWTLWVLFLPTLIVIQLASIWGATLLLFRMRSQRAQIAEMARGVLHAGPINTYRSGSGRPSIGARAALASVSMRQAIEIQLVHDDPRRI